MLTQLSGYRFENEIARGMAIGVVELLEVVEIDHEQEQPRRSRNALCDQFVEPRIERGTVRYLGKLVDLCRTFERLFNIKAFGDVLVDAEQSDRLALGKLHFAQIADSLLKPAFA